MGMLSFSGLKSYKACGEIIEDEGILATNRPASWLPRSALLAWLHPGINISDRFAHGGDLLSFFVRDLALEFLFNCHDEFYQIERVRFQVFAETCARNDLT